ncbi:hypothetical protein [Candidatus Phytoplasma sp. AldY-WA1]|uniref:hypothetical protein n=1 Tax=Candidatus Phytoplasma sp. AldY-WA1 TaxID=2852100 RepID=UPI00254B05E7|nr:hypothetical protein [Candidatus Phytoplasma sp. AldY-WA1]
MVIYSQQYRPVEKIVFQDREIIKEIEKPIYIDKIVYQDRQVLYPQQSTYIIVT